MTLRIGKDKLSFLLPAFVLLALFVFGPLASVFAELDEPPRGTEPVVTQRSEATAQRDGNTIQIRSAAGQGGLDLRGSDRETVIMDNLRRGVLVSVSWIFLVVGLTLVAMTLGKIYNWLKAVQRTKMPPTRYFNLQLQVRGRDGDLGLHNFDYYPVVVAAAGRADLLLPDVADSRARFRVDYHQGQAHLHSDSSIIVNGVPRQQKLLKQDDRIIFGPYRLMFKDASIREQSSPIPGKPVFVWQFPIVALLLALSILFKQAGVVVPEDKMLLAKAAELQSAGQHGSVLTSTEQSSEQPDSGLAAELSPERITLNQRLRRLFSGPSAEEVRLEEAETVVREQRIVDVAAQEPVVPEPAPPQGRSVAVSLERPAIRESAAPKQKPVVQRPQPQKPQQLKPTEVAIAKAAYSTRQTTSQTTPTERISPRTAAAIESSVPTRTEIQRPPNVSEDWNPSGRKVAVSQPMPARKTVPASEPSVQTTAQVPVPRSVDAAPVREEASTLAQHRASQQPPVLQASVLANLVPATMRNNGINPLEGLSFTTARSVPEIRRVKVRVIPPGRPPEYFRADILFIHAHPDDESLDFGSLMARASRSNKRIVTLLFTDGESGLDLYPQRKVGDIYPARDLTGGALSQVRVVEATRALSVLGSEMYIRWGLENRPYNTKRDEVPPEEVIRGWGGEDQLVERLIEVLEGFSPTIVVSPDRHSKAYEHFEHEAVGQLVQTALQCLRQSGKSFVKGYLVSIDPYQVDRYSGVTEVDAQALDGESGLAYRSIQAIALKEHVTQRDASVIGVSRLSHLPQEFYKTMYWDLDLSLEEYLK